MKFSIKTILFSVVLAALAQTTRVMATDDFGSSGNSFYFPACAAAACIQSATSALNTVKISDASEFSPLIERVCGDLQGVVKNAGELFQQNNSVNDRYDRFHYKEATKAGLKVLVAALDEFAKALITCKAEKEAFFSGGFLPEAQQYDFVKLSNTLATEFIKIYHVSKEVSVQDTDTFGGFFQKVKELKNLMVSEKIQTQLGKVIEHKCDELATAGQPADIDQIARTALEHKKEQAIARQAAADARDAFIDSFGGGVDLAYHGIRKMDVAASKKADLIPHSKGEPSRFGKWIAKVWKGTKKVAPPVAACVATLGACASLTYLAYLVENGLLFGQTSNSNFSTVPTGNASLGNAASFAKSFLQGIVPTAKKCLDIVAPVVLPGNTATALVPHTGTAAGNPFLLLGHEVDGVMETYNHA